MAETIPILVDFHMVHVGALGMRDVVVWMTWVVAFKRDYAGFLVLVYIIG